MIDLRDLEPEEVERRFRCRDGLPIRIYAVDGGGDRPIHGAVWSETFDHWACICWTADGSVFSGHTSNQDLIPRREEVEYWVYAWYLPDSMVWTRSISVSQKGAERQVATHRANGFRTAGPERVVLKENVE